MDERLQGWLDERLFVPFAYQREAWQAYAEGRSALVHAPTGMGKTLAAWLGPVDDWLTRCPDYPSTPVDKPVRAKQRRDRGVPIEVLWITPLRALVRDIVRALSEPIDTLHMPWTVEARTGDSPARLKQLQRDRLPTALVTTPESLALLLSYPGVQQRFQSLKLIVCDEWHELMGSKRGVLLELMLAHLRAILPGLRSWGLSATIGNLDQAMRVLTGTQAVADASSVDPILIRSNADRDIRVRTLIPDRIERFPWAGHLGVRLVDGVVETIDGATTSLMFTNTRSQAELWFEALQRARPDWVGAIGLHHGSLSKRIRSEVEDLLAAGRLRAVVCTSSLDLGVDFSPVDQVLQIGSPKGIARLLQRAGRSGHRPGAISKVVCVPTHAFELVEFAGAREAIAERDVEPRPPVGLSMDVLAQHLVTLAAGDGFEPDRTRDEIRTAASFESLTDEQWRWALEFITQGGASLTAYDRFRKVELRNGRYVTADTRVTRQHRMSIGTIPDEVAIAVRFRNGRTLGTIEEYFIAKLSPGDVFMYAGRSLELLRVHGMVATVRPSKRRSGFVPRWQGGRFSLTTQLADRVLGMLEASDRADTDELRAIAPLLELQRALSDVPGPNRLLIEQSQTRDGHHAFIFAFAGRLAHEGLGVLLAHRLTGDSAMTITVSANDYGIELFSMTPLQLNEQRWRELSTTDGLLADLLDCVNAGQMARRSFRDIARIAGLTTRGFPGERRSAKHLQASSDLFYDVFEQFDPGNLLLDQARREVLTGQLDYTRMRATLERLARLPVDWQFPNRLTPLSFPLYAERLREQELSSESWRTRIERVSLQHELEAEQQVNLTT